MTESIGFLIGMGAGLFILAFFVGLGLALGVRVARLILK